MAHNLEKKTHVLESLEKFNGDVSKCARATGVDRKTVIRWKEENEKQTPPVSSDLPSIPQMKEMIIQRIHEQISKERDIKKLAETYKYLSEFDKAQGNTKTNLYDELLNKIKNEND